MTIASAPVPGTTRAARTARTRAEIIAAAHRLFAGRGYRATSLREVALEAGLSHTGVQRHFPTKDALLAAVIDSISRDSEDLMLARMAAGDPGSLDFGSIARHNAEVPGYMPLYAALTGEASTASHPAHDLMRADRARLVAMAVEMLEEAIVHDVVSGDRDPYDETIGILAAWDGLQLLTQYLPDRIDLVPALESYQMLMAFPLGWRDPDAPAAHVESVPVPVVPDRHLPDARSDVGYRTGRARRARIIADATALFARGGYGDTSLSDIAQAAGVSKSTLLHHFASKDELLGAVLVEGDRAQWSRTSHAPGHRAAGELRDLVRRTVEHEIATPGLVEAYVVLSCEAVPADHPAHAYFTDRFRHEIDHVAALLRAAQADGDLPSHRDPESEAIWLVAMWNGLQYQWLYDPDSIDVGARLAAHLDDLLPS